RHVAGAPAYLRVVLGAFDRLDVLNRGHVLLEMVEQGRIEHGRDDGFDGSVEGVFETEVHDGGSLHQRPGYGFSARLDFTLRMGPRMLMDIESSSTLPDTSTETPSEKGPPPSSSKISPRSVWSSQPPPNSLRLTFPRYVGMHQV